MNVYRTQLLLEQRIGQTEKDFHLKLRFEVARSLEEESGLSSLRVATLILSLLRIQSFSADPRI